MTRRLRNSLNALLLTSAVCAMGAFAVAAVPVTARPAVVVSQPASAPAQDAHRRPGPASRVRHLMAVPYFSFVTRG